MMSSLQYQFSKTGIFLIIIFFSCISMLANASSTQNIPDPLKPWTDWVLDENDIETCPYFYNSENKACIWPSTLRLNLNNKGGTFTQQWHIYAKESQVQLPGDKNHWPLNVSSNNKALLVSDINGIPHLTLTRGKHTITGSFKWGELPKTLGMTPQLGLLKLSINNKNILQPKFNQRNTLWLSQDTQKQSSEDNLLDLQVFRRINDNHPIRVETIVKIRASGKQRNIELSPVMLDGFIPINIESPLPARIDGEKLTVQLRPGEWQIKIGSRVSDNISEFALPASKSPWPQEEIWVFSGDNNMRQVEISGASSIDPSQTGLPKNWLSLPAYLMKPNQTLKLKTIVRGKSNKSNEKLSLRRQMWLDSNGNGYTIKDQLSGNTELTRLNVLSNIKLGNVSIDNQPQLITSLNDTDAAGVEIRQHNINLKSESRYDSSQTQIPVSGWKTNLHLVTTDLHLPAGWRLFFANGTDNLPKSWVSQWSLLDLFIVLVITFACGKVFNKLWGGIALVSLVLTWHETNAPTYIWLLLLITIALIKYMPDSKFKKLSSGAFISLVLILGLFLFNYTVETLRYSFFPQLENTIRTNNNVYKPDNFDNQMTSNAPVVTSSKERVQRSIKDYSKDLASSSRRKVNPKNLQVLDPNSKIQTGPGLPTWSNYQPIRLHWSGPVKAEQMSRLILIPPLLTAVIRITGIILLLLLTSRFVISFMQQKSDDFKLPNKLNSFYGLSSVVTLCIVSSLIGMTYSQPGMAKENTVNNIYGEAQQTIPRQDILDELKVRLKRDKIYEPPTCLPNCAHIESMNVEIDNNIMVLRLRAHASTETTIPLPGSSKSWLPESVVVNNNINTPLQRNSKEQLWANVPKGLNTIVLRGPISQGSSILLPLPLQPRYVTTKINAEKWTIDGINNDGKPSQQLQLTRITKNTNNTSDWQTQSLAPFVMVDRYFELGLDWQVITTIQRISNNGIPINIDVDLLEGEQPISEQLTIKDRKVSVKLDARQNTFSWASRYPVNEQITLVANQQKNYLETWRFNPNAIWHWQAEGIPVNLQQQYNGISIPVWRPWPKEVLKINVSRPKGTDGQTVTILNSQLNTSIAKRAKEFDFSFTALSSRGTQHEISLPKGADIQKITIDKIEQSIQQSNNKLMLTLKPGKQNVHVQWREDTVLSTLYKSPLVDLKLNSVNAKMQIKVPRDRWLLWTYGPTIGPAVLFWGVIIALFILAFILGQSGITPLKTYQWALLALGLSQTSPLLIFIFIAWLAFIKIRANLKSESWSDQKFNSMQVVFALLTVTALIILGASVANGLLGNPSMIIKGNGSYSYLLNWYQDRASNNLPQAGFFSMPMWVYRMLMLAWALWLATSVIKWLQMAWQSFNVGGLWRANDKKLKQAELEKLKRAYSKDTPIT